MDILFILDRSGSMGSCAPDAVKGFNNFLKKQKKENQDNRLTLLQFDHEMEYTYKDKRLKKCKKLKLGDTYAPRGMTALVDAIGMGIKEIKNSTKAMVAIYTDGYENASSRYTISQVKDMIKKANKKGWEVIFLAAEINPAIAWDLGFSADKVAIVNKRDMLSTMNTVSQYTTNYMVSGNASNNNLQDDHDKNLEKEATT